jgi:hypothetical protein
MIEPQCRGFSHAAFNAALLDCFIAAYPSANITFLAEPDHLQLVQTAFRKYALHKDYLPDWTITDIPKRSRLSRLPWIYSYMRRLLVQMLMQKPDFIIFSSISSEELYCLKKILGNSWFSSPVYILMHGNLNTVHDSFPGKPWKTIVSMRKVLQMPDPNALQYLVLGESILQSIREIPFLNPRPFKSMDIPHFWINKNDLSHQPNPQKLHFGFLGIAAKGLKEFSSIALRFKSEYPESKWSVVGYCNPRTLKKYTPPSFIHIHTKPLPLDEYVDKAAKLDYIIWTSHCPEYYKLTASATFFDALSLIKPGIYLSNRYIDYYFKKLGDVGYLCKDHQDMLQNTQSLLSGFRQDRYETQLNTIHKQRSLFNLDMVSSQLREITNRSSLLSIKDRSIKTQTVYEIPNPDTG